MIFKKIIKFLRSLRVTAFLIICLVSIFIIGVLVPQKDLLGKEQYLSWKRAKPALVSMLEATGLNNVHSSPITLTLWGIFFLNLIFVMTNRIPVIWKRCMREDIPQSKGSMDRNRYYKVIEGKLLSDIGTVLRDYRFRVFTVGNSLWAVRNRYSPLATILFHLSFFLLFVGVVMTFYTKFRAEADVAVGETFSGNYRWVKPPKFGNIPKTVFRVEEVTPTYYKRDLPIDLKVVLRSRNGSDVVGINKPYKEGALSFVVQDIDVAPFFIMRDEKGQEIEGAFFKLIVLGGNEDSFRMGGYEFITTFYTNVDQQDNAAATGDENMPQVLKQFPDTSTIPQQREIINPAFHVVVRKDGIDIARKTIRPNEFIQFDGQSLVYEDLKYWVKFYVGKEHGLPLVYTAFAMMTIALALRFIFYRRDVKGFVDNEKMYVSGKAEFYPALFADEFETIIRKMRS